MPKLEPPLQAPVPEPDSQSTFTVRIASTALGVRHATASSSSLPQVLDVMTPRSSGRGLSAAEFIDQAALLRARTASGSLAGALHMKAQAQAEEVQSGLTQWQKLSVALAGFATAAAAGALMTQPKVYISLFGGDATLIGAFNVLVVPYDMANGPFFGRLADEGFFNKICFADLEAWGRRAPLTLIAIPIGVLSFALNFIGPEGLGSSITVAVWYGMVRLLLTTCFTMHYTASDAAFCELFPCRSERVSVLMTRGVAEGLGMVIGAGLMASAAMTAEEPGTPGQRSCFMLLAATCAVLWLLTLPWALLQRRTVMKRAIEKQASLWVAMREVWHSGRAFIVYAVSGHFWSAAVATMVTLLPFFMQSALFYSPTEVALGNVIVVLSFTVLLILGAPPAAALVRRFDPSFLVAIGSLMLGVCNCGSALLALSFQGNFWASLLAICGIGGASGGLVLALYGITRTLLLAWIVDEDQVIRVEKTGALSKAETDMSCELPARRDGIFGAISACFSISGAAWSGLVQVLLGFLGYDGQLDKLGERQPEEVRMAIVALFVVGMPLLFITCGCVMLYFPLKGGRLKELTVKYQQLFESQKVSVTSPPLPVAVAPAEGAEAASAAEDTDGGGTVV